MPPPMRNASMVIPKRRKRNAPETAKTTRTASATRQARTAMRRTSVRTLPRVRLWVTEGNERATALYRKLGFAQVGKRPGYYAGRDGAAATGALVMRRDLR